MLIAVQINTISQKIDGINEIPFEGFCGGAGLAIVDNIDIRHAVVPVKVGSSVQIEYITRNVDKEQISADLEWFSENPEIVTVDSQGKITGVKKGSTLVHARFCDVESSVRVNVTETDDILQFNPCTSRPRPISKGVYSSRAYLTGKRLREITGDFWETWIAVKIKMYFDSLDYNAKIIVNTHVQNHEIWTEWVDAWTGYVVKNVRFYTQYGNYGSISKPESLECVGQNGFYTWNTGVTWLTVSVYPNSRSLKVTRYHGWIDKTFFGFASF